MATGARLCSELNSVTTNWNRATLKLCSEHRQAGRACIHDNSATLAWHPFPRSRAIRISELAQKLLRSLQPSQSLPDTWPISEGGGANGRSKKASAIPDRYALQSPAGKPVFWRHTGYRRRYFLWRAASRGERMCARGNRGRSRLDGSSFCARR